MKIIHIENHAGVSTILRDRLKGRHEVKVFASSDPYGFKPDVVLGRPTGIRLIDAVWWRLRMAFHLIDEDYDVLHFNSSLMPFLPIDLKLWKLFGAKVIVHHHGSDIRGKGQHPMEVAEADAVLLSTPDLRRYADYGITVPNPVELGKYIPDGSRDSRPALFHSSTNRKVKGTDEIDKVFGRLTKEDICRKAVIVFSASHENNIEYMRECDIVVDQLNVGWYGCQAIEAMALGKPVVANILEDMREGLPIVHADKDTLYDTLKALAQDYDRRKELGEAGRRYVESVHDADKVAGWYADFVESL